MIFPVKPKTLMRLALPAILGLGLLVLGGCLSESSLPKAPRLTPSSTQGEGKTLVLLSWTGPGAVKEAGSLPPARASQAPWTLVQASPAPKTDATSSASTAAEAASPAAKTDATSSATAGSAEAAKPAGPEAVSAASANETKDAAYCLKCHGPFEKLQARTKDYVTQWDEHVNPHVYIPHDSKTLPTCTECHTAHPIPYQKGGEGEKATVKFCYSCHHTEELKSCKECHKD